jgi:translation initiation factor IF-2
VLGFTSLPLVGTKVLSKNSSVENRTSTSTPCQFLTNEEEQAKDACFKAILKTDTQGTLEAIANQLPASCALLKKEVGEVSDSDVLEAAACNLEILAFNLKLRNSVQKLAETEGVHISSYKTIYELVESVEKRIEKILSPEPEKQILGKAEVLAEFVVNKNDRIAGCRATEGLINRANRVIVERKGELIGESRVASLRLGKEIVDKVEAGKEFGLQFTKIIDFNVGDMILSVK